MIERLPLELQFGILDQVVWSWWELIEMRFVSKCVNSVATSYMSNFTSFEVTVNEPFTSSLLEICFRSCPKIRRVKVPAHYTQKLMHLMKNHLNKDNMYIDRDLAIDDPSDSQMIRYFPKSVRALVMPRYRFHSQPHFLDLLDIKLCENLRQIDLRDCVINYSSFFKLKNVEHLTMKNVTIESNGLHKFFISRKAPIKKLELDSVNEETDLTARISRWTQLTDLHLETYPIAPRHIEEFNPSLLTSLIVDRCESLNREVVLNLAARAPRLNYISLSHEYSPIPRTSSNAGSIIPENSTVEAVQLGDLEGSDEPAILNPFQLRAVSNLYPKLQRLSLGSFYIHQSMSVANMLKNLKSLILNFVDVEIGYHLSNLLNSLPNLESFTAFGLRSQELYICSRTLHTVMIESGHINSLFIGLCPKLTELWICDLYVDKVRFVSRACPMLESLDMLIEPSGDNILDPYELSLEILFGCPNLKRLNINNGLSTEEVKFLARLWPEKRIVGFEWSFDLKLWSNGVAKILVDLVKEFEGEFEREPNSNSYGIHEVTDVDTSSSPVLSPSKRVFQIDLELIRKKIQYKDKSLVSHIIQIIEAMSFYFSDLCYGSWQDKSQSLVVYMPPCTRGSKRTRVA
jgi:hypothetical protein